MKKFRFTETNFNTLKDHELSPMYLRAENKKIKTTFIENC